MSRKSAGPAGTAVLQQGRYFKLSAIAPLLLIVLAFSIYPLGQLFSMSFAKVTVSNAQSIWNWVGLENYLRALQDPGYWKSVTNTFIYVAGSMSVEFLAGLGLALLSMRVRRGVYFYRTVLMLPLLVPPIAVATSWRLIYNANFGLINKVAGALELGAQHWLAQTSAAFPAVIAVSIWYWTAYSFILLLAGLQNIPGEYYESAHIDGASGWQRFLMITLPLLKPAIAVTILFRAVNAFKVFDIIYALTSGGPGLATEVINTYVYRVFISQQQLGYGASLAMIAIIIVGTLALIYSRAFGVRRGPGGGR